MAPLLWSYLTIVIHVLGCGASYLATTHCTLIIILVYVDKIVNGYGVRQCKKWKSFSWTLNFVKSKLRNRLTTQADLVI
jgi:hypothetical protein